ncbi:MAG: hypothetical protein ACK4F9_01675 [Brevinematia bacterium]
MLRTIISLFAIFISVDGFGIAIKEFKLVNYSNVITINPIFIVDISYELEENSKQEVDNSHLILLVKGPKTEKFNIEEDTVFQIITNKTIRLFLPISYKLASGKNTLFLFKLLDNSKAIFETNLIFQVSNILQEPIILSDFKKLEISRKNPKPNDFFFVSQNPENVTIINTLTSRTNLVKPLRLKNFKGLYSFSYVFNTEGLYKIIIGKKEVTTEVYHDRTPPQFRIMTPTEFYRTNNIKIKWSDPVDISGVDFEKSSFYVKRLSNVITNISPLISLNKESSINPYEVIYIQNIEEGEYEYGITYSDYDGNTTNIISHFRILPIKEDKYKPTIEKLYIENSKKISENQYLVRTTNIVIFVEVTDSENGSGVKMIHYKVNEKSFSENVFGNSKYISLDLESNNTIFMIWAEDFNGNLSETNIVSIIGSNP